MYNLTWYPIKDAPKDGTKILLAKISDSKFNLEEWRERKVEPYICWAVQGFWSHQYNNWNDGCEPTGLADPTHFMILQPPMRID